MVTSGALGIVESFLPQAGDACLGVAAHHAERCRNAVLCLRCRVTLLRHLGHSEVMRGTVLAVVLAACGGRGDAPATKPPISGSAQRDDATPKANAMMLARQLETPPTDVKTMLALRDYSEGAISATLGERIRDVGYEKMKPLDRYGGKGATRVYFFFRGPQLVMAYSGDDAYLAKLSVDAIERELGAPEKRVRSRQGKNANQQLYPGRGFAYSEEDGKVGFVEVFPPMALDDYLTQIYDDPGEFIK